MLPLFAALAGGRIWRWFAINIPMDLGTGGSFTSDIDILARLHDFPRSDAWLYRTWEVKVSLLCKDGSARSLKSGKMDRTVKQLKAYRNFGSPDVSLLDVYLCEAGFVGHNPFPPSSLNDSISSNLALLTKDRYGYQLLPFEHGKDGDVDVGLRAFAEESNPILTTISINSALTSQPHEPFSRWADRINKFFEQTPDQPKKHFKQIVFCRNCHALQLIRMRDTHACPICQSNFIIQS